jgi:hypothetical protein
MKQPEKTTSKHIFSIRTWVIVLLMLFALVPSLTMSVLLVRNVHQDEREQGVRHATETVNRMASDIRMLIREAEQTAEILVVDETLRIASTTLHFGTDKAREIEIYRTILRMVNLIQAGGGYSHIRVFLPESKVITHEQYVFFSLTDLDDLSMPFLHQAQAPVTGWTGLHDRYVPGSFTDKLMVTYYREGATLQGNRIIVVAIDIEDVEFQAILRKSDGIAGSFSLYDGNGSLIATQSKTPLESDQLYPIRLTIGAWTLVAQIPLEQFSTNDDNIRLIIIGTVLVCALMIPFLATLAGKRPTRELMDLEESSKKAIGGKYSAVPVNASIREVRTLQIAHNAMMVHIKRLIRDVYEAKLKWQEAKTDMLIEQIKPHFLYNTLESAKWLAAKHKDMATVNFLEKLAQFYRLGLSEGDDFVPLHQELRHVRLYTELMALRTGHALTFLQDVPEALLDVQVMKLMLQPLVENAIEHGILQKEVPTGTIAITVQMQDSALIIEVQDDGVGMKQDLLEQINSQKNTGFGIKNVRLRLATCYGREAAIKYFQRENGGITVRLRFVPPQHA